MRIKVRARSAADGPLRTAAPEKEIIDNDALRDFLLKVQKKQIRHLMELVDRQEKDLRAAKANEFEIVQKLTNRITALEAVNALLRERVALLEAPSVGCADTFPINGDGGAVAPGGRMETGGAV